MVNDTFLEKYTRLEGLVRDKKGMQVKEYEDTLSEDVANNLRMCRTMRNYFAHNNKTFVSATADTLEFVDKMCERLDSDCVPAIKKMRKVAFTENSKAYDIADYIAKIGGFGSVPIFNKTFTNVIGIVSNYELIKLGRSIKASTVAKNIMSPIRKADYEVLNEKVMYSDIIDFVGKKLMLAKNKAGVYTHFI